MYPLLRQLESRGLIAGEWEHPQRRTRRYYSLTDEGQAEYHRLVEEVRPFLDSVKTSIDEIVHEVYDA
jgi:DNA-binding PadR family transcriptional regulator